MEKTTPKKKLLPIAALILAAALLLLAVFAIPYAQKMRKADQVRREFASRMIDRSPSMRLEKWAGGDSTTTLLLPYEGASILCATLANTCLKPCDMSELQLSNGREQAWFYRVTLTYNQPNQEHSEPEVVTRVLEAYFYTQPYVVIDGQCYSTSSPNTSFVSPMSTINILYEHFLREPPEDRIIVQEGKPD